MNVERLLAKIAPKTIVPTGEGAGSTGTALSCTDVAAALSMAELPRQIYLYALAKYCLDHDAARLLLAELAVWIKGRDWGASNSMSVKLAMLCLLEQISPNKCRRCNGRGEYMHRERKVTCRQCDGRGRVPMRQAAKARMAGVPRETYRRKWLDREQQVMARMSGWDATIAFKMNWQMRDAG